MTFNPVQLLSHDVSLRQSWLRLQRRIESASASSGGWQNILFVGKDGNDATAQPNSIANKYLTIQAAVNAWSSGYIILVGPGIYQETVTLPGAFDGLVIAAVTPRTAIIEPPAGQSGIVYDDAQPSEICLIHGMNVQSSGASTSAIHLDASGASDSLADVFFFECVIVNSAGGPAITATRANSLAFEACYVQGDVNFANVGKYEFSQTTVRGVVTDEFDVTRPVPTVYDRGVSAAYIRDSFMEEFAVRMQARVDVVRSRFNGTVSADLRDDPNGAEGVFSPTYCEFSAGLVFDCKFGNAGVHTACLGRYNSVQGGLTVTNGFGAPVETRVMLEHTIFSTGDPIACTSADTNLYLWGSTFSQDDLALGNPGAIDRDSHRVKNVTIPAYPAPPTVIKIDPPFTNGGSSYACVFDQVQPTPAGGPIIGVKLNDSVTVMPDPAITIDCDLTILAQRL